MLNRLLLIGLYWIALAALAWATRLPPLGWAFIALGAVPGVFRAIPPALRFLAEAVLLALVIVLLKSAWGAALQMLMAIAALTISRSLPPLPDRAIMGSLPLVAVAALIDRAAGWAFIPFGAVAVLALVSGGETTPRAAAGRTRLALSLALAAAVGASLIGLIVRTLPWQTVVAGLFSAIAYPFMLAASKIHLRYHGQRVFDRGGVGALHHSLAQHGGHYHAPILITIGIYAVVVLFLAFLVFLALIFWARNDESLATPDGEDKDIVREQIEGPAVGRLMWIFHPGTPVRRLAYDRLREAKRVGQGRDPSETLREWMRRQGDEIDSTVPATYDAVRYGQASDTAEKRRSLERLWPRTKGRKT